MAAKTIFVLCAHALFVQVALSQCLGRAGPALAAPARSCGAYAAPALAAPAYAPAYAGSACGYTAPAIDVIPTSGGALPTSSVSSLAPSGLSVESENAYEGTLLMAGELPFLSAVALEAVLPTAGTAGVNYSCGNGVTAITSEALGAGAGYGYGAGAGYGYGAAAALAPARAAYAPATAAYAPAAACGSAARATAPAAAGCGCGGLGYGRGLY